MDGLFKSAIGGFRKADVLAYIEQLNAENQKASSELLSRIDELEGETHALRDENAALRNFLQSRQTDGERWDPVWTAARWPGGFLLAQPVQAGAAVLDRSGRFAGIAGEHGTVSPAGSGAGAVPALVGQALGTLTRQNGVLWVTGLPCSCKAAAGELAVTAQGQYWAGQLAAAPQPDPGGLTLRAPLEDTADETDCLYFIGG